MIRVLSGSRYGVMLTGLPRTTLEDHLEVLHASWIAPISSSLCLNFMLPFNRADQLRLQSNAKQSPLQTSPNRTIQHRPPKQIPHREQDNPRSIELGQLGPNHQNPSHSQYTVYCNPARSPTLLKKDGGSGLVGGRFPNRFRPM